MGHLRKIRYLTLEDRKKIQSFLKEQRSYSFIANHLKRSMSTILYEIERCGGRKDYSAESAQNHADEKQKYEGRYYLGRSISLSEEEKQKIADLYTEGTAIAQIAKSLERSSKTINKYLKESQLKKEQIPSLSHRMSILEEQIKILADTVKELYVRNI